MDLQHVLNFLIGAVLAALGWFARQMWDAVAALREDIEDMVGKIFDKLDGKQDK